MRIETMLEPRGGNVMLFGDFYATIEIYKRIRADGGVMENWIGTWVDPQGVRVDLFDNVITLRKAQEEAVFHLMHLWENHVAENGTVEDLDELIKFDQTVTRCLGLSDYAVATLRQKIQKRMTGSVNPIDVTVAS